MDNSSSQPLVAEDPSAVKGPINLNKKTIFLSLGIIIVVLVIITVLVLVKNRKNPAGETTQQASKIQVPVRVEYKNPFDKKTQYVNPFSSYKNPLDFLK
ncbi:MAG: hypothetical protein AAB609_03365 [Patescibacteria group bacterium]